jgi:subtilase family serine protease
VFIKTARQPLFRVVFAGWAVSLLLLIASAHAAERQILHGHVVRAVTDLNLQPVGKLASSTNLDLVIGLPLRNQEALTNLLEQQYAPTSPQYHHWLTPAEFTAEFGPTERDYQAVIEFANANGFIITGTHHNRTLVDVRGSVADVERTFRVTLHTYQHPTEARQFYASDVEPSLDLSVPILHITGLNNYSLPHPLGVRATPKNKATNATPAFGSGPSGSYMGYDFRSAYVPGVSLTGSGQVVGLVEFDGYFATDINNYESQAGLPHILLQNIALDGFSGTPTADADQVQEVSLDIEMAISMAPGLSKLVVYEAFNNGSATVDLLNQIATDNLAKQISCSWALGDDPTFDQTYQQYAAQGQSFFQASGDNGAYTSAWTDQEQADSPYITLVGGTTLTTTGPEGAWQSETAWNWNTGTGPGQTNGASGGGISLNYPIPVWQKGINMASSQGSKSSRNVPDVAMVADGIYVISDNGSTASDIGGTSCAAPLWAGFIALVNQQAVANGQSTVGFINPAIYAIGTGTTYAAGFHDITSGNNETHFSPSQFSAVSRYDLCTGWGTPHGSGLINAFISCVYTIATSPAPSGGGSTSGGGTVNCGSNVTVIATPSLCYNFVNWTENSVPVSTSPSYTFATVVNGTLVANFTPALTALINTDSSPSEGGITSGGGSVTCGSSVTVSATPSTDYSFAYWTEGGAVVSTSSNYTFTATGDSTLVANFTCPSSILPTNASYDATGGEGIVTVTSTSNCAWTASSSADWIAIMSGASGSGGETVSYTVATNKNAGARTGAIAIAGQTFTVDQATPLNCIFTVSPASIRLPAKGGSKTVKLRSLGVPCDWIAVSNDPFITITAGASGTGSATVRYTVPGNTNTVALTGTMTIAGQTFTVNQAAGGCTFSLSPKSGNFKASGGSKIVKVKTSLSDCTWTAISNDPFITIIGNASGAGKGTVGYIVAGNTNNTPLTGTITIGGQTFTITQSGAP